MQRLALPHIMASEPSALKMRMEKSASGTGLRSMSTSPSEPMPLWRSLHAMAQACGSAMGCCMALT